MNDKYIRVGTTHYKIVQKPLQSGDTIEVRVPWRIDTLKQDHSNKFITQIPKYDGFCCVPSHTNYQPMIGSFLNEYQPIDVEPHEGQWSHIEAFLRHIFGDQFDLGMDYLQLLYTQPSQRLPIILLVSKERNTGKTTFLNLLKAIFGANMTFNTNEDFRSQFNSDWATKLLVAVDEVLLDRKEDSERIKNLSTAKSYKSEAKGKDRNEVEFFAKFVLCSNNELNPIYIEQGETRYWVRKVEPIEGDNPNLLLEMRRELGALLAHLEQRTLTTTQRSRMWFSPSLIATEALHKIVSHNRGKVESEMLQLLQEILEIKACDQYEFTVTDMAYMLEMRGHKTEHTFIRRILQQNLGLTASEPYRYTSERLALDGSFHSNPMALGRCYKVTRKTLERFL